MPRNGYKISHGDVFFKEGVGFFAQVVFGHIQLHFAGKITQMRKGGLAHQAQLHQTPRGAYFGVIGRIFGFSAGLFFLTAVGIGVMAGGFEFLGFGITLGDDFVQRVIVFFSGFGGVFHKDL